MYHLHGMMTPVSPTWHEDTSVSPTWHEDTSVSPTWHEDTSVHLHGMRTPLYTYMARGHLCITYMA